VKPLLAKWLDWPPLWTLAGAVCIWILAFAPLPIGFGGFGPGLGLACLGLGIWLMASAFFRMRAQGTTINPRGTPSALVTDGVFAISRNPIYLGDALALLGLTFWLDVVLGLAVVAGFVWVINERFVSVEEGRLQQQFPEEAGTWFLRVRRWI
jgi:protein-S-isoprenylcysteine O-methyltransferase Ste14